MAAFCLSSVKWLVTRASTPPGFRASTDLAKKKSCRENLLARVGQLHIGKGHVADHGVERRKAGIAEVFDADVGFGVQGPGDAAGNRVHLHADEAQPRVRRLMKLPVPQPGSRMVAPAGTPKRARRRAWP